MTTRDEILSKLTELKPLLLKDYAVREIGLFGSFSDNSFTEDSDIDLLVDLERPIGWKFFSLEIYLEKVFGRLTARYSAFFFQFSIFKPGILPK
jgi:predicted nucleotidyltransferase